MTKNGVGKIEPRAALNLDEYRDLIASANFDISEPAQPELPASVVVVTFGQAVGVAECLAALREQQAHPADFEIVVVDNGTPPDVAGRLSRESGVRYVRCSQNMGPSVGRNLGALLARGNIICFLDDDAIPADGWVISHLTAHRERDIVACRGKTKLKTRSIFNRIAATYDLGDELIETCIDAEGNSSFRRDALLQIGGFRSDLYGGEGLELSYRLAERFGRERIVYYPEAVIYHDYCPNFRKFVDKLRRNSRARGEFAQPTTELREYARQMARIRTVTAPPRPANERALIFATKALTRVMSWF